MSQIYDRVALIGLGLIASSIFWASKRNKVSGCVTGFARSKKTRDTAKKLAFAMKFLIPQKKLLRMQT